MKQKSMIWQLLLLFCKINFKDNSKIIIQRCIDNDRIGCWLFVDWLLIGCWFFLVSVITKSQMTCTVYIFIKSWLWKHNCKVKTWKSLAPSWKSVIKVTENRYVKDDTVKTTTYYLRIWKLYFVLIWNSKILIVTLKGSL